MRPGEATIRQVDRVRRGGCERTAANDRRTSTLYEAVMAGCPHDGTTAFYWRLMRTSVLSTVRCRAAPVREALQNCRMASCDGQGNARASRRRPAHLLTRAIPTGHFEVSDAASRNKEARLVLRSPWRGSPGQAKDEDIEHWTRA